MRSTTPFHKVWLLTVFLLTLALSPVVYAADDGAAAAAQVVQNMTNQVLQILQQHEGKPVTPALKKEVADAIVPHIDFQTMSAYVMASYWRQMNAAQQKEFTKLFEELLIKTYSNALNQYHGQTVKVQGSQQISQNPPVAQVNMTIQQAQGKDIPIIYALIRSNKQWRIYNIYVDGVSLILNYRQSFGNTASERGIPGLLRELRSKVAEAGNEAHGG
ncbi:ABC transporter substrate-binding protein [Candidatus Igneacidithiobacillus taiwanensis]|uniref:MlaC/ttg2D family ABC transporter substrate-binding protein n=1 Tax=Candidatus Igneacidithiobacillus taiwanensis TaxID=1945924 RepID=UPI00289F68D8|nr:ABC transporter substrate-binding protein [Candidatus Igneacidithiobacillus taiwanensis]MCE5361178.1 ABC transporter substrate-binding protein [Acidithiobacillus sp.]